jgi:signal transduction histidine kinase/DNA-binding response OmpR family regulator
MSKNNSILNSLLSLLVVFVIGYLGIVLIHNIFSNILDKLDSNIKNEYSRYKIGEYILKEINDIETNFYKIGVSTKLKSTEPIKDNIEKKVENIKEAIKVLENGGTLKNNIFLNVFEASSVVDEIIFRNDDKRLVFESIDLLPKLEELKLKVVDIEKIMKIKLLEEEITLAEKEEWDSFKISLFFKQLPTFFSRMKENASRLLYDSKKNIDALEKNIKTEKEYYKKLENLISYFTIAFVIALGYFLIKQILRKNDELELITKRAKESEEEALIANQTKSQFLANMSHEIRTPLNAIIGFSDILSTSSLADKDREKASIISKSAKALLNIINDILDISKIESGKFEISKNGFDLRELLEQIVQLYTVSAMQKNIRLFYTMDENIPIHLVRDETKLKQVISNILSNAIKFTPQNGKVFFYIKLLNIKNHRSKIKFSIKDEGIVISLENQKKIFEPFSQADGSISRKFGGTGLGLAICLNIVKLLDSEIKLESVENEGSTFFFELDFEIQDIETIDNSKFEYDFAICSKIEDPENIKEHLINTIKHFGRVHEGEDIEKCEKIDLIFCFGDPEFYEKLSNRKKHFKCKAVYVGNIDKINNNNIMKPLMNYFLDVPILGSKISNIIKELKSTEESCEIIEEENIDKIYKGNVLVAEDNSNNQLLIKLILEKFGLNVTITQNGQIALDEYKKNNYDLVLMDINMPIMDGLTALKHIREYELTTNTYTPVVALTANTLKGDKEKFIQSGMDYYLSKPIQNDELIDILELCLNKENNLLVPINKINTELISQRLGISENIAQAISKRFLENIHKELAEFEIVVENADKKEISQKAHYLKNSCLNVCLDDISALLQELENNENLNLLDMQKKFQKIKKLIKSLSK